MDKSEYPDNWQEIRHRILARDNYTCTSCNKKNLSYALIESPGKWLTITKDEYIHLKWQGQKVTRVYIQVCHIDNNKSNCDDTNLISKCSPCHLRMDAGFKAYKRLSNK